MGCEYPKKLLDKVINTGLCSGCGTCAGVCPKDCISFQVDKTHIPEFDMQKCINCGLCLRSCPSNGFSFTSLKKESANWDERIGPYVSFLNSNATDEDLMNNGASGGTVSAIFQYLLEKGLVDRVVCVQKQNDAFQVYMTDNADTLAQTQGSKYIPIPLNTAIGEILKNNWTVAVVGTSCHLQGIEKASHILPKLKELVKYKVGIFCGFVQSRDAFAAVRKYLEAEGSAWSFDGWRCGEYPGYVRFTNQDTKEVRQLLIYDALCLLVPFYSLEKCFMCPDGTNMSADFSFGDIHSRGNNKNCGIIRTRNGAELVENMVRDGYLETEDLTLEQAMKSTVGSVSYMKGMRSLLYIHTNRKPVPEYDMHFEKDKYRRFLVIQNRVQLMLYRLARKRFVITFLEKHPKLQMRIGRYIYTFPNHSLVYKLLRKVVKR